ncbi:hypothetical protein [Streptomyces lavenduligriseus]|uniref:Cell envelope biogenesis protein OmpA n=1 Tax=Streptomyces lavenduligriseus TaxID=67315 RepID=A0ABT0P5Z6_9ACTN|nr:hypothetical protein [Streptomyces lavenduligriseus]MCL3999168.1 hypothetical protein [Streptomyces lavenduligriseus]
MSAPAIPAACAHRPTHGGLVVPYVSFEHNGLPVFGGLDPDKRARALENGLCQICESPLGRWFYVLVRPQDVGVGYAPEPGLHPPCLIYSEKACPMLNGTRSTYRAGGVISRHPAGRPCEDAACSCPATAPTVESQLRSGRKADDWDAWMLSADQYELRRDERGGAVGIQLPPDPKRIRRVRVSPERKRALALMAALQELGI